jgi:hypothetical protein
VTAAVPAFASRRSLNLVALIAHYDARLEPGDIRFVTARRPANAFAPGAFIVAGFGRLTGFPQVDASTDTLIVVEELFADETRHILKTRSDLLDLFCHCSRVSPGGNLKVTTAVIMAPPFNNDFTIYAFSVNVRSVRVKGCPSDYVGSTSGVPPTVPTYRVAQLGSLGPTTDPSRCGWRATL